MIRGKLADSIEEESEVVVGAFGLELERQRRVHRFLLRVLRREALDRAGSTASPDPARGAGCRRRPSPPAAPRADSRAGVRARSTSAWNCGSRRAVAMPLSMSASSAISRVCRASMSACTSSHVEVPEAEHWRAPTTATNAPIWACHGSLLSDSSMNSLLVSEESGSAFSCYFFAGGVPRAAASPALRRRRRRLRVVEHGLDRELEDVSGPWLGSSPGCRRCRPAS